MLRKEIMEFYWSIEDINKWEDTIIISQWEDSIF